MNSAYNTPVRLKKFGKLESLKIEDDTRVYE